MAKSVVLLSAGLDSTVNFLEARQEGEVLLALTFDYGQKAARQEVQKAQALSVKYKVPHRVIDLSFFKEFTKTSLLVLDQKIPQAAEVDIHSLEQSLKSADRVWVPNRNGIFLNIGAGFAEGLGAEYIIPGFNLEEASTFPDNSKKFQEQLDASFALSTQNKVRVKCYTIDMDKSQILKRGLQLGLDINDLWPCYFGEEKWCGQCESCLRFENAKKRIGV